MANRNGELLKCLGKGRFQLSGSFAPNGSGTLTTPTGSSTFYTVARTGTGAFTITLADKWVRLISCTTQVQLHTAAATICIVNDVDVSSAGTIKLTLMTESTGSFAAADVSANANNQIFFSLILANTAVTP